MSGGSYDYLYYKMQEAAETLMGKHQPNYRRAFGELMLKCAKAMHDIEWVDSADKSPGNDQEAIMKCITKNDVLNISVNEAKDVILQLQKLIKEIEDADCDWEENKNQ